MCVNLQYWEYFQHDNSPAWQQKTYRPQRNIPSRAPVCVRRGGQGKGGGGGGSHHPPVNW